MSLEEATCQYLYIAEMVEKLQSGNYDEALEQIYEHPLSIRVRSDWESLDQPLVPCEYEILLCTGGPAVKIYGRLNRYLEPTSACLKHQDWFTQWKLYVHNRPSPLLHGADPLLPYARCFYYGE